MAFAPRVEFSSTLVTAAVETASVLLTLERPASRHEDALSVEAAWAHMDCTSYGGQTRAAPALALVKALRIAHDEAQNHVFWPIQRNCWRNALGGNSDAATVATTGTAPMGMVAPGVATRIMEVATTTTPAWLAAVMEAR